MFVTTSAVAQEQKKPPGRSVSPDGKWEFRAGAAGEQDDFVIAKAGSDETSLVLSEEEYVDGLAEAMGRAPGYANIVWAPDSKRFAYNLHPTKAYQTVQFYQLDGNTWRKLDSLESNAGTFAPLDRSMAKQKKELKLPREDRGWPIMTSWQVRKWIDSSTALVYAHRSAKFELKNDTEEVNVSFFFTLKFDPVGNWTIVRTRDLPSKGFDGLNKEEREEVDRLKNSAVPTPESLILSLYSQHRPGQNKEIDWCERKSISRYCDTNLTDLYIKNCECEVRTKEVCNLDWDPFYDAQDFDESEPNPRIKQISSSSYEVTITNIGERKLIYEIKKTKAGWRVSDVKCPLKGWSLVQVLSGEAK